MAISENRITIEQTIENNKNNTDVSSSSSVDSKSLTTKSVDKEPAGLISKLPTSITQFSSFKELSLFAAGKINQLKSTINSALTIPNLDDLINMTSKYSNNNLNALIVNRTLGIFKAALCGDGRGIDLGLDQLLRALDYKFDFLRDYNVCGRQQVRNPLDVILKSKNQVRDFYNGIINIDKKLLNNFLQASNTFVNRNKLPIELQNCTAYKSLQEYANDLRNGLSTGWLSSLQSSYNNKICSSSDKGFTSTTKTMNKAIATPFISGMVEYDKETMYSSMTGILNNSDLDRDVILDILGGTLTDKDKSNNTIKTLELVAYTKVVGSKDKSDSKVITTSEGSSIQDINNKLQGNGQNSEYILDNILNAHEEKKELTTKEVTTINKVNTEKYDMLLTGNFNALDIICNLKDDVSEVTDSNKEFNNIVKLLEIADPKFKSDKSIDILSLSDTIKKLAVEGSKSNKKNFTTSLEKDDDNNDIYVIDNDLNTIDYVNIMNGLNNTEEILICQCTKC